MTNEEAIKILKGAIKKPNTKDGYLGQAIDMAIKALETSSCIKEKCAYCPHCEHCDVDDETLAIKALERIEKSAEWVDDKCSACGKGIEDLIDSGEWYENEIPNYCPFCGKRFKESEE